MKLPRTLYNECVKCHEKWQVLGSQSSLHGGDIQLDDNDLMNITNYGQLFSICEDCNEASYDCESVLKTENGYVEVE